ncbi:MAG TPA: serine hydrolase [Verrucomicrobiota bacterium]|nr:serine hydrolase [Verrucomicrobiota bacterium]HNU52337.1 serine hydrolase [Verrucomicrobiota bacterium]
MRQPLSLPSLCWFALVLFAFGMVGHGGDWAPNGPSDVAPSHRLELSIYATAGDVLAHLAPPDARARTLRALRRLEIDRVFLEGRRGDEYVPPESLSDVRDFLHRHGIRAAGGIATVPGRTFGTRQNTPLGWLHWESPRTRGDVRRFFEENAAVFDEIIVDDFFCTADTSPESELARGNRTWSEYRRELLTSLIGPLMIDPARKRNPAVRMILKFPQWYDRFHLFGYDPPLMAPAFDQVWVGTEVRNPRTARMGYVPPTEGYMNFTWLASATGNRTVGAWFDHIECTPENFIDQAWQSVLAGARELTLFHLGDVVNEHPGDSLLAQHRARLSSLARRVQEQPRSGIAFYKPPGGDADDNLYLADFLGMLGLPVVPVAQYPTDARVVVLAAQAAADPAILARVRQHLSRGATLLVTPAFVRRLGDDGPPIAGVEVAPAAVPGTAITLSARTTDTALNQPIEIDRGVVLRGAQAVLTARSASSAHAFLTRHQYLKGDVWLLNTRTFDETEFGGTGEWLLCPRPLGLSELAQPALGILQRACLDPLGVRASLPAGVGLTFHGPHACLYNFQDQPTTVRWNRRTLRLEPHAACWLDHALPARASRPSLQPSPRPDLPRPAMKPTLKTLTLDWDTPPDPALQTTLERIDSDVRRRHAMGPEHTAAGLLDLESLRLAFVRPDRIEYAASLPKIGILLAYFEAHPEAVRTIDPKTRHRLGLMIKSSSNEEAAAFSQELGLQRIQGTLNAYGFYDPARSGGLWIGKHYGRSGERYGDPVADHSHAATVRQLLRFYLLLEQGRLVSPAASRRMIEIFDSPEIPHDAVKFVAGLEGRNLRLRRKLGSWEDWQHDTAVVAGPGRNYILVALTHHPQGDAYLADLARAVDDALISTRTPAPLPP